MLQPIPKLPTSKVKSTVQNTLHIIVILPAINEIYPPRSAKQRLSRFFPLRFCSSLVTNDAKICKDKQIMDIPKQTKVT